jgi:hypothetical protein
MAVLKSYEIKTTASNKMIRQNTTFLDNAKYKIVVDVLKKINLTHQSVHIHANTELPVPHIMLDIVLPELLEVTFVRKKDIVNNLQENDQIYPLDIDESTFQNNPDLFLGKF